MVCLEFFTRLIMSHNIPSGDSAVRRRNISGERIDSDNIADAANVSAASSDEDDYAFGREKRFTKLRNALPQASDKLGYYIDSLLQFLPER